MEGWGLGVGGWGLGVGGWGLGVGGWGLHNKCTRIKPYIDCTPNQHGKVRWGEKGLFSNDVSLTTYNNKTFIYVTYVFVN